MNEPEKAKEREQRKKQKFEPYKVRIGGRTMWQVNLESQNRVEDDGRRVRIRPRRTFSSVEEARSFAELKRIERKNHGTLGISMPERLRVDAIEADRLLAPYDASVLDAAREYIRRREVITRSEAVGNAFTLFMATKTGDNLRPRYLEDLRTRISRFVESFKDRKLADIEPPEIDVWLRELGVASLTRNTFHLRLSAFFEFARQRGWVEVNPLKDVPKAKVTGKPPGILAPEQVARLLESASEETLPIFALGVFAGLRSAEIERLAWHHIKWDERLVEVPALSSKTASRRLVTMLPILLQWLSPYRNHHGSICPPNHLHHMIEDRRKAGITSWPSNAMRHSYASYHLAMFKDAPALSLELGHVSPQIVFAHYREVVRPSEAEKFWRIVPAISAEPKIAVVA